MFELYFLPENFLKIRPVRVHLLDILLPEFLIVDDPLVKVKSPFNISLVPIPRIPVFAASVFTHFD